MTMLPFLNQFFVPTFVSVYIFFSSFLPHTGMVHAKAKIAVAVHHEKVIGIHTTPTPTPTPNPTVSVTSQKKTFDSTSDNPKTKEDTTKVTTSAGTTSNANNPSIKNEEHATPTPPVIVSQTITAKTTLAAGGKIIHLTMQYPSLGGNISGTISGDCNGTVSGTYSGSTAQTLSGKGNATCSTGFISVPVNIIYSGKLTSSTNAQITYTVSALGQTESGNTNLSLE